MHSKLQNQYAPVCLVIQRIDSTDIHLVPEQQAQRIMSEGQRHQEVDILHYSQPPTHFTVTI